MVLVLFVLAVVRSVERGGTAPAASAPAPAPAPRGKLREAPGTRALLGGIGVGDSIDGWRIDNTRIVKGKRLAIAVQQGKTGFTIWIARKGGSSKRRAPRHSEKYDFFFGEAREYGAPVPPGAERKVLATIFQRVQRVENHVPVPPGL